MVSEFLNCYRVFTCPSPVRLQLHPRMLGYISSTRKKSCHGCVKAKRRCDLGYPFCKRCFVKGLDCEYPNAAKATFRDPEVIIRQATPDFAGPAAGVTYVNEPPAPAIDASIDTDIDPLIFTSGIPSDSSPETWSNSACQARSNTRDWRDDWNQELSQLRLRATAAHHICRTLLPEIWAPSYLNDSQVQTVIRGLCAFVPDLAFSGSTTFIHQNLYSREQPQAYQDAVALSALYLTCNPRNQTILANSIGSKISNLTATSSRWTLSEHLAAVQALIIYQIIRLFDPSLNLQAQAEKHNTLLELWSAHLWKRFFNERQNFKDSYECWVFAESLRRTVLISVFTRCGWSIHTRGGLADQVPVLARLPFTRDMEAWTCEPDDWNVRTLSFISQEEMLVAYGDLTMTWSHAEPVERLDPFGKLLLAACRGGDDPRLLE